MALDEYDPRRGRAGRPWRRAVAYLKQHGGNTCHLCGQPIDMALRWPNPRSWSADHITPLDLGGHPTHLANLAPAHLGCNAAKGARQQAGGERVTNTSTDW